MQLAYRCSACQVLIEVDAKFADTDHPCPSCGATGRVPPKRLAPGTILNGFRIEKHLDSGAMGEIFLARQLAMDRLVALKVLHPQLTLHPGLVERFLAEVRLAARLEHPNIVTAYTAGEDSGVYYMAMAFVAGQNLEHHLRTAGRLSETEALRITGEIARALAYAWDSHQLIHRDIKPSNIILGTDGAVKLADMGLSKCLTDTRQLTHSGTVMGTPNYMSPEQADGARPLDFRSDLYALGATLHHMLTGQVPYAHSSFVEVLRKQAAEALPDPRLAAPSISPGCVELLATMLAKDPNQRHASWQHLIDDLDRLQSGRQPTLILPRAAASGMTRINTASTRSTPRHVLRSWRAAALALILLVATGAVIEHHRRSPGELSPLAVAAHTPLPRLHVAPTSSNSHPDGTSWANAFTNLEEALFAVNAPTEIWVASGTYRPARRATPRDATFELRAGVALYGGFAGHETARAQRLPTTTPTVLSGDLAGNDGPELTNYDDNAHHVITVPQGVSFELEGFTITGGNAMEYGGGILFLNNIAATASVRQCTFQWNRSGSVGGAVCELGDHAGSTLRVEACTFRGNVADGEGGAIFWRRGTAATIENCTFIDNHAADGGALRAALPGLSWIRNCRFVGNTSSGIGGALSLSSGTVVVEQSIFADNRAVAPGGAIFVTDFRNATMLTLDNCLFTGNQATGEGAALAAMYNTKPVSVELRHCTLQNNRSRPGSGAIWSSGGDTLRVLLRNTIVWDNPGGAVQGPVISMHSNIAGGWHGDDNLNVDPRFVDPQHPAGADGQYGTPDDGLQLAANSPCRDFATDDFPPATDLLGAPRRQGPASDLGAYETVP